MRLALSVHKTAEKVLNELEKIRNDGISVVTNCSSFALSAWPSWYGLCVYVLKENGAIRIA